MACKPPTRMGPPPWSFAADAHGCIVVRIQRDRPNTSLWRDDPRPTASSPQIVFRRKFRLARREPYTNVKSLTPYAPYKSGAGGQPAAIAVILGRVGLSRHNLNLGTPTMTDDKIALRELLEKGSDTAFLREMIGFAAHRLMELETDGLCGAGHGERRDGRRNHRTGYRDPDRETPRGHGRAPDPQTRRTSYVAGFLERRHPAEKALTAVIKEPLSRASPPSAWTASCRHWAWRGSARAPYRGSAARSTSHRSRLCRWIDVSLEQSSRMRGGWDRADRPGGQGGE